MINILLNRFSLFYIQTAFLTNGLEIKTRACNANLSRLTILLCADNIYSQHKFTSFFFKVSSVQKA